MAFGLFIGAAAEAAPLDCHFDEDGDGYYTTPTSPSRRFASLQRGPGPTNFHWPAATAACGNRAALERFAFDCDDDDARVHPRRRELANGIDDTCNGTVDEPTFWWSRSLWGGYSQDRAITLRINVLDRDVLDAARHGKWVMARVDYRPIDKQSWATRYIDTGHTLRRTSRVNITVGGLEPGTVYAFRVQFVDINWAGTRNLGDRSDHFFSITTDSESDLSGDVRAELVTAAFYEFYRSNNGDVGYMGRSSADGSDAGWGVGYGAFVAQGNTNTQGRERWCSEFYASVLGPEVETTPRLAKPRNGNNGDSSSLIRAGTIGELANDWFAGGNNLGWNAYVGCSQGCTVGSSWLNLYLMFAARPGDYVHTPGHSTMFLGYDWTNRVVWVVDGNGGYPDFASNTDARVLTAPPSDGSAALVWDSNVVGVRAIPLSSFTGWGRVLETMTGPQP
ncbi:MAG: hypothetical protein HRU01_27355 [Myxococcales bacterium]|nr:hypothetical protein [Myxococcales bacterium]